jgi:hypothetical protein
MLPAVNRLGPLLLALLVPLAACENDRRASQGDGPPAEPGEGEGEAEGEGEWGRAEGEGEGPGEGEGEGEGEDPDDCEDGQLRCSDRGLPQRCVNGGYLNTFPCEGGLTCADGHCVAGVDCDPGTVGGCSDDLSQRVCLDSGDGWGPRACPEDAPQCFQGTCGHQICTLGRRRCRGEQSVEVCGQDGEAWATIERCDEGGAHLVCIRGECTEGCGAGVKAYSYIGCEYWSVDLPQYDDPFSHGNAAPHAVVLSNTGSRPARITVETHSGAVVPAPIEVGPGEARSIEFPRLDIDGTGRSLNSFKIRTTEPVVAYQFNPLNNVNVASNDASLLLPVDALGLEHYILSWPGGVGGFILPQTAWFTIVGASPGTTQLQITFSSRVMDGGEFEGIEAGQTLEFAIEEWEVLNFEVETTLNFPNVEIGDVTGSHVVADRPIAVFAGHKEAVLGERGEHDDNGPCCADHLEQQLFPVEAWGSHYLAVHSPPRGTEVDHWRILASRDGTQIATDPAIEGLDGVVLDAGEFAEAATVESFEVTATEPVLVGQFLVSQTALGIDSIKGDPAFILAVPVTQFRDNYVVLTPENYREDWITIMKPAGAEVVLDDALVAANQFEPFGSGDFVRAWIAVEPGAHAVEGDAPFAVAMFGYDSAVSYGYPGGLDLDR